MAHIGVIGLGAMGWALAATVVNAGHETVVFDADPERVKAFSGEFSCRAATQPRDLCGCDVVVTILPNGQIVRSVLFEEDDGQLAKGLKRGAVVIDMSSADPRGTIAMAKELEKRGVWLVDAPISKQDSVFQKSGVPRATAKPLPLVLMAGGEPEAIEKARPVLEMLGETVIGTGGPGSGHAAKTLNNYAAAGAHVALAEALLMAKRFGLSEGKLIEIINVSTGRSFISQVLLKNRLADDQFKAGFTIGLMAKDMQITAELAEQLGFDAPACRLVLDRWNHAREKLGADSDVAEAVPAWDNEP